MLSEIVKKIIFGNIAFCEKAPELFARFSINSDRIFLRVVQNDESAARITENADCDDFATEHWAFQSINILTNSFCGDILVCYVYTLYIGDAKSHQPVECFLNSKNDTHNLLLIRRLARARRMEKCWLLNLKAFLCIRRLECVVWNEHICGRNGIHLILYRFTLF